VAWLFREALAEAGLIELFEHFGQHLEAKGYIARGGQRPLSSVRPRCIRDPQETRA
jgi:hypothetical protein